MRCECGSTSLFHDRARGELVCRECGLVVEESLPAREAHYVRYTSLDHSGPLAFSTQNPINPLKIKTHGERRLEEIYHELRHKETTEDVKERALWIARKYLRREGALPIHSIEDFAEALVYLVSRERRLAYKPTIPAKTIMRVRKSLVLAGIPVWGKTYEPEYYLGRIIPGLGLGEEVKRRCMEILIGIDRFTPATRAAASVALALEELGEEPRLREIARCAGISPSTLWKAIKALREERGETQDETEEPAVPAVDDEATPPGDPLHSLKRLIRIFRG
jgi:transcription initiation factor TFIIIB Brf1 subunit/transcription initiation factor TFIIB